MVAKAKFSSCVELLDGDFARPVVRINNSYIDAAKKNKSKFFRREPVVIKNLSNGSWTLALCFGAGNTKGITKQSVGIEYDTADILGVKFHSKEHLNLVIHRASIWRKVYWYLNHPDHGIRTSMWFAITGLISFFDSMLSHIFDLIEILVTSF